MTFTWLDFFIGFFLMNAMPHLIVGLFGVRFLSFFGFSTRANIAYAAFNVLVALVLFHFRYGIGALTDNGILLGALVMLLIYLVTGRYFYQRFQQAA